VDPVNPQYVYAEYQYGALHRSSNGGGSMEYIGSALAGRKNWSMPVELDPSNPARLVAGTDRVYRTTNRGTNWMALSTDLTDGSGGGNTTYGTITALAIAPTNPAAILAGTDDANVWITTNTGGTWTRIDAALPERWITRVAFDPGNDAIVYATVSGFRWDEPQPHVFRSTNHGAAWEDISGNLPEAPVNDLLVDGPGGQVLYAGTDFGVMRTTDAGASWHALGTGLPNVVVTDLELHQPTRTLVAGTYGRSMWTFDLEDETSAGEFASGSPSITAPTLAPVVPNPARERLEVRWALPRAASVSVEVVDVSGRRVALLAEGPAAPGAHAATWDRRAGGARRAAAGVYFVRLAGDGVVRTRKVVLLP
jgi:photosystem II stability/assembly factor-like uncharacterized protein